jgi:hypothetical protein
MDICKIGTDLGTDSETIQAECELIQKQVGDQPQPNKRRP